MSDTPRAEQDQDRIYIKELIQHITGVDVTVKVIDGEFIVTDPAGQDYNIGLVRKQ